MKCFVLGGADVAKSRMQTTASYQPSIYQTPRGEVRLSSATLGCKQLALLMVAKNDSAMAFAQVVKYTQKRR